MRTASLEARATVYPLLTFRDALTSTRERQIERGQRIQRSAVRDYGANRLVVVYNQFIRRVAARLLDPDP